MKEYLTVSSPVGPLTLVASAEALHAIRFDAEIPGGCIRRTETNASPLLLRAARELAEYFAGSRRDFTLPLAPQGTPFQQAVWAALRTIPYGQTRTYGQIAARIGHPRSCRTVGMANHRNPLPIVIPCHRVVGSSGALTGYAGGLPVKEFLLNLETTFR